MQLFTGAGVGNERCCSSSSKGPLNLPHGDPPLLRVDPVAVLKGHGDRVWCVSWCPTANVLASCSGDGTVRFWSCLQREAASEGQEKQQWPCLVWECIHTLGGEHSRTVRYMSWSPSGEYIACASFDRTASVWKRSSEDPSCFEFELEAILDGHESEVKCVVWATDSTLATCSRDRTVWVWDRVDFGEFECAGVLAGHAQDVKACAWILPTLGVDEKPLLLSCSYDNTVKVWTESHRRDDWHCTQTLTRHEGTVWSIAVQPVEQPIEALRMEDETKTESNHPEFQPLICCCSDDRSITFWARDAEGKFHVVCVATGFAERTVYSVCWAPSGSNATVACGSGDNKMTLLGLYKSQGDEEVHVTVVAEVPCAHEADVNSVAFSHFAKGGLNDDGDTGLLLASGGDDNTVRIWRVSRA